MDDTRSDLTMTIEITDDLDLTKIAESGQCFRWERVCDGGYRIIHGGDCLYIFHDGGTGYRVDRSGHGSEMGWRSYLDLDEDYRSIRARIDRRQDPFLYAASQEQKGIRILRQDPWEVLISFILSQNKNIPAIRGSIEALARSAGERRTDLHGRPYHAFPTPGAILDMSESDLRACKVGYRWKYVRAAADAVSEGRLDLSSLIRADEEETIRALTGLYGVGPKVASCVSLYGLHHTDAFPIDVWMRRIIDNEYAGRYPYGRYSPYNGIYQQYMFASYRKRYA